MVVRAFPGECTCLSGFEGPVESVPGGLYAPNKGITVLDTVGVKGRIVTSHYKVSVTVTGRAVNHADMQLVLEDTFRYPSCCRMKHLAMPTNSVSTPRNPTTPLAVECWFEDTCVVDMDYFVKTLSGIKAKGIRPDLIGSIITSYASKWLPDLSDEETVKGDSVFEDSPESVTAQWTKKRFFVETLVGVLPPEKDAVPCNFLLRLLRTANMVGVEPSYRAELEKRISWQLDQASLKDLMIPAFSHTCKTLLDVELVFRLVKRFMDLDEAAKTGIAVVKVAKLVDCYLAEAAIDANLGLPEFVHPGVSKQERKILCRLIDCRKLSTEASLHAAQNERLPVRAVIQVLFSENIKINRQFDWSGSFTGNRSPSLGLEPPARCLSKREVAAQQMEMRKLREEVLRLQSLCNSMQGQIEKLTEKKKGFFRWRKLSVPLMRPVSIAERTENSDRVGYDLRTPEDMKAKLVKGRTPSKWRKSIS
ncbi:hypothetical protein Syun_011011 [Stephania yunnanensis]|uniref:NPH3 domain-containing protein n=1 Tax=Stephania yunnanensis TaxID=152371 RepID=A0AAP0PI33_9MAGN